MTSDHLDPSWTIKKAASRARGDRLSELFKLCEIQKTVNTRRLLKLVEELAKSDRADALHFKALAKFVCEKQSDD